SSPITHFLSPRMLMYEPSSRILGLAVLTAIIFLAAPAAAQTFRIEGRVLDEHRRPLPGAVVRVENLASDATDENGAYELTGLPAGSHVVRASYLGYRTEHRTVE